jgi:hypothetical protein
MLQPASARLESFARPTASVSYLIGRKIWRRSAGLFCKGESAIVFGILTIIPNKDAVPPEAYDSWGIALFPKPCFVSAWQVIASDPNAEGCLQWQKNAFMTAPSISVPSHKFITNVLVLSTILHVPASFNQ